MSQIMIYSIPDGTLISNDYTIKVRTMGEDVWEEVPCYQVKVDMHEVRKASMAYFDFTGKVEVEITCGKYIYQTEIRPISKRIVADFDQSSVRFVLDRAQNLSIEINKDRFHNLHLFAGNIPVELPKEENIKHLTGNLHKASIHRTEELTYSLEAMKPGRTLYFGPGFHYLEECTMRIPSDTTVYIAGGAVIVGTFICSKVTNVRIIGRGVMYLASFERFSGLNGIRLSHSQNIHIEGITLINPPHYSVYIGGSTNVTIKDIKSFSCEGWSDGIDIMSSKDILVEDVFLRTSDDCIAIYGRRWDYNGDSRNIVVRSSTLWADVAHPLMVGTHGDFEHDGNIIESLLFEDIDILEHHEYQAGYLGCMTINVGDKNIARDITFDNIRVEPFEHGKLLDVQVIHNPDYNPVPGKRIENILFKDITYTGSGEVTAVIKGYSEEYGVSNIVFQNLRIRGKKVLTAEEGNIAIGPHVKEVHFR